MAARRLRILIADYLKIPIVEATQLIKDNRVLVNGESCNPTRVVQVGEIITLDGEVIDVDPVLHYVIFNKPRGIECTMNETIPDNLTTVFPFQPRLFPVGRLDKLSEGLLLMMNDGKLYHEIAHADSRKEKEYYVEVHKPVTEDFLQHMRGGVKILNTVTDPCEVFAVTENDRAFRIILKQGMNRQIRRMSYNLGFSVHKLVRTRIMHLQLEGLLPGQWRELTETELKKLLELKS